MSSAINSCLRSRRGVTSLEFGLVGGIFLLLMLGAMQLGLYLFTRQSLDMLTGLVARAAVIGTVSAACPATLPSSIPVPPILSSANLSVCVTRTNPNGATQFQVVSTYRFTFFLPILSGDSGVISEQVAPVY